MPLRPIKAWQHTLCGNVLEQDERPTQCGKCDESPYFDDLGWRVGFGKGTDSWYSTYESALKDKRVKG